MPIVFPKAGKEIVEKIVEVVKEVVKPITFSPSVSVGMEMGVYPHPQPPEAPFEFPVGVGMIIYSLRAMLTALVHSIVSNPSFPETQNIIATTSTIVTCDSRMTAKPSISVSVVSDQTVTVSPDVSYSFNPSVGVKKTP